MRLPLIVVALAVGVLSVPLRAASPHVTVITKEGRYGGTLSAEGETGRSEWPAGIRYGFTARAGEEWFIARWDEKGVALYRGAKLAESDVMKALGQKTR